MVIAYLSLVHLLPLEVQLPFRITLLLRIHPLVPPPKHTWLSLGTEVHEQEVPRYKSKQKYVPSRAQLSFLPLRLLTRIPRRSFRHCARSRPQSFPILCEKSTNYELCAGVINAKVTYTPGLDSGNVNSVVNRGPFFARITLLIPPKSARSDRTDMSV